MTPLSTYHQSVDPAEAESLRAARDAFLSNEIAVALLDAVPDYVAVLNTKRQIVVANRSFVMALGVESADAVIGLRPGDAVGCRYRHDSPGGCGSGKYCMQCGAFDALTECLLTRKPVTRECQLLTQDTDDGGALDLEVRASVIRVNDHELIVLAMRDLSAEKRRQVLERVFFHDVLNTASSLRMASQLLQSDDEAETSAFVRDVIPRLSQQIIDEINAQRQLLAAEQGALLVDYLEMDVMEVLRQILDAYAGWNATDARVVLSAAPSGCRITTDVVLLRRVLGNLVKNALEAGDGAVTLAAEQQADSLVISVHNPAVIPEAVQRQIFKRSFSTKAATGRGVGTYSVKLFTERYLGGAVTFTSADATGTTFVVTLPLASEKLS